MRLLAGHSFAVAGRIVPGYGLTGNSITITGAPSISGTQTVGNVLTGADGTATGTGVTSVTARQWFRDGAAISGATGTTYTLVAADDATNITFQVTWSDDNGTLAATSAAAPIAYPAPTASNGLTDQVYEVDVAISAFDVSTDFTGTDISYALAPSSDSLPAGLSLSSAGSLTGTPTELTTITINIVVRGTNSGGTADSAFSLLVADVPDAFVAGDWTLTDPATDGELAVGINSLPGSEGLSITDIEYKVDAGAWTSSGGTGAFSITGLTNDVSVNVQIRAVNDLGSGAASDTKAGTPTTSADVTAPTLSSSSFDGTDTVSLTSDEAGTVYWLVDDNATRTAAQVKTGGGLASGSYTAESGANSDDIDVSAVQGGNHYLHLMIEDAAGNQSNVDSVQYGFADTVAPTLTSPTDAANGSTASTGSVSTDEADGTLYWVVTTSATAPTAAQVKLGQDNTGTAADGDAGSQSVSSTGAQALSPAPSGLTASTAYTTHFMHEDSDGNQSSVASASGFTTDAAASTPAFQALGTGVSSGGADITASWPTHVSGDVAILVYMCEGNDSNIATPSGWTHLTNVVAGVAFDSPRMNFFTRTATGAAESDVVLSNSTGFHTAQIITVRGASSVVFLADGVDSTGGTAVSIDGGTVGGADRLILGIVGNRVDSTADQISAWTNGDLTSITDRGGYQTQDGTNGGLDMFTGERAATGTIGATTATLAASSKWGGAHFEFAP